MKYKITHHVPNFVDLNNKEDFIIIENSKDIYNLEFVKRIRNLRRSETLLIVNFTTNVIARIEKIES